MEKRFFLAIILSFCAVMVWSSLAPKPISQNDSSNFEQNQTSTVSSSETSIFSETIENTTENIPEITDTKEFKEEKTFISSDNLTLELTSKGGNIKHITINELGSSIPVINLMSVAEYDDREFKVSQVTNNQIEYFLDDQGVRIIKRYKLQDNGYLVQAEVEYKNIGEMSKKILADISTYVLDMSILDKDDSNNFQRESGLYEYSFLSGQKVHRKGGATSFNDKNNKGYEEQPSWIGFRNRYNALLVRPLFDVNGHKFQTIDDKRLRSRLNLDSFSLAPGASKSFVSKVYAGPQKKELLQSVDEDFDKIFAFSRFGLLNGISLFIHQLILWVNKIVPNWGLCIIITSTIIYLCMYPLTMRGMLSMKRMQSMQPKIAELKEKYKDNPQKMNKEMMEIYKKHKINPLGGCLPFLLQMPIFIGLYQVLWRSVEFKGASFLWIKDLSQPDRLFTFSQKLPLLGNEFNILPFFMMIIMFFQQKLSAKNMNITDPAQKTQQKIMSIFFPIFLGVLFYKFASGLTLYFTVFYLFSTFTQLKMSKKVEVVQ